MVYWYNLKYICVHRTAHRTWPRVSAPVTQCQISRLSPRFLPSYVWYSALPSFTRRCAAVSSKRTQLAEHETAKLTQERDASTARPSAEKRFDDIVHVEFSQMRVLLACPNEKDGLSGLVTHGQCRAHLSQMSAEPRRFGQRERGSDGKEPRINSS